MARTDDWFEIYNTGTNAADLGGYYLTANLTNKTKFLVPGGGRYIVQPQGFLVIWADNNSGQNSTNHPELHTNFKLSKSGEALGLFAADGTTIDAVSFGAQSTDVSEGRFRDGGANRYFMPMPTPGAPNVIPNTPPTLSAIADQHVYLGETVHFSASATDYETPVADLFFSLDSTPAGSSITAGGVFTWTAANVAAPSTNYVTIVVTDTGSPVLSDAKTFAIVVEPPPQFSSIQLPGDGLVHFSFNTLLGQTYRIEFKNDLNDPDWLPFVDDFAGTGGMVEITDSLVAPQRFFRIVVVL